MSTIELRWNDYSLSEEQEDVRSMLQDFFTRNSPSTLVREAEPLGFDADLWQRMDKSGLVSLAMGEPYGGQGGGLVELVLAAVEVGRTLAPVPFIEHTVATRLLGSLWGDAAEERLSDAVTGELVIAFAPSAAQRGRTLVPGGAIARAVVALDGDDLVLLRRDTPPEQATNQAHAPVAWWDATDEETTREVLASGEAAHTAWNTALAEWKVATAASLSGLAAGALQLARTFATERIAFGSPIAKFQAVSHQLVDIHMAVESMRHLALKAAWFTENEPAARPELPSMALAHASRATTKAVADAVHLHGGLGITLEADVSLYYQRAAVWGQLAGGTRADIETISAAIDRIAARHTPSEEIR